MLDRWITPNLCPPIPIRGKPLFLCPSTAREHEVWLSRWSFIHALLMLPATAIAGTLGTPWVLAFFGGFSFLSLIIGARHYWTPGGSFGAANTVTTFRLVGVSALPLLSTSVDLRLVTVIGLVLLIADGLDGWVARRRNQTSEFGEYLDKETDAFLLLVLCTLAVLNHRLGHWFLLPGLLRYVFVIVIHFFRPSILKEQKSERARIIYSLAMAGALAPFLPYPTFYSTLAMIGTMALLLSFMIDFYRVLSTNRNMGGDDGPGAHEVSQGGNQAVQ